MKIMMRSQEHRLETMSRVESAKRLGNYLRTLRKGYGYVLKSVEMKARQIGWSLSDCCISDYEKGRRIPPFRAIMAFSKIYSRPIEDFSSMFLEEDIRWLYPHSRPEDSEIIKKFEEVGWYRKAEYMARQKLIEDPDGNREFMLPLASVYYNMGDYFLALMVTERYLKQKNIQNRKLAKGMLGEIRKKQV